MPLGIVPGGEAPHIRGTGECGGISCHICSLSGCSSYRPGCQVLAGSEFGACSAGVSLGCLVGGGLRGQVSFVCPLKHWAYRVKVGQFC